MLARLIAFYLPQFHRIPENDEWWGAGFTEWTNVRKATPLFSGHDQPVVPTELGYYDLTDESIRERQADLARTHGIEAFCYWHYWFGNGRRILERPFNEVLDSGRPDFPFCLCWANETWTGVWHGAPGRVLVEQTYPGDQDEAEHFAFLATAFADKRYVRVEGKPVFLIYNPFGIPDLVAFTKRWRHLAKVEGLEDIYLVAMTSAVTHSAIACFDAVLPSPPGDFLSKNPLPFLLRTLRRTINEREFARFLPEAVKQRLRLPLTYPFETVVDQAFADASLNPKVLPCVLTGWDNTPRSKWRGLVLTGYTPRLLAKYLRKAFNIVKHRPFQQKLVFLKAWNEWAEGNILEPTKRHERAFLSVVSKEVRKGESGEPP